MCKALRESGVFQDRNRHCPFRLTQKTDSLGERCHGAHLRENAEFLFPDISLHRDHR